MVSLFFEFENGPAVHPAQAQVYPRPRAEDPPAGAGQCREDDPAEAAGVGGDDPHHPNAGVQHQVGAVGRVQAER